MAMRPRTALSVAPRGFLRLFSTTSTSSFIPSITTAETSPREKAEPNTNLFVSGISKRTTTEGLREAFSKFGEVVHARVVTDRVSGYSKGFGFVRYASLEDAAKGIEGMDGKFLDGWVIFAEYARPRPSPTPPGNNVGPGYGSSIGPAFWNAAGPAHQSNTGPAYQSNMSTTAPAYTRNSDPKGSTTGPANLSNMDSTYGSNSNMGPGYGSSGGPAYGNSSTPTYRNTSGTVYGNMDPPYRNHMGASYGRR